jgi:hypothetical protein
MVNNISCWAVDWNAISAVATAFACVVALYVAMGNKWSRKRRVQNTFLRLRILLKIEIATLEALHQIIREGGVKLMSVRRAGPPDSNDLLEKCLRAQYLRASLEQADLLSPVLVKRIAAIIMLLDAYDLLLTSSAITADHEAPLDADALRNAIDNLNQALIDEAALYPSH